MHVFSSKPLHLSGTLVLVIMLILSACAAEEDAENANEEDARVENGILTPNSLSVGPTCDPEIVEISVEVAGFLNPLQRVDAFLPDGPANTSFSLTLEEGSNPARWTGSIPVGSLGLCADPNTYSVSVLADDGEVSISESSVATLTIQP